MSKPTYLYHATKGAKVFDEDKVDLKALELEGWHDSPAKLRPAPTQEAAKLDEVKADLEPAASDDSPKPNSLLDIFKASPTKLTKEELVTLADTVSADVRKNWKEATIILKIQEKLNVHD